MMEFSAIRPTEVEEIFISNIESNNIENNKKHQILKKETLEEDLKYMSPRIPIKKKDEATSQISKILNKLQDKLKTKKGVDR